MKIVDLSSRKHCPSSRDITRKEFGRLYPRAIPRKLSYIFKNGIPKEFKKEDTKFETRMDSGLFLIEKFPAVVSLEPVTENLDKIRDALRGMRRPVHSTVKYKPPVSDRLVKPTEIDKEPGYSYYVNSSGDIWRRKRKVENSNELVLRVRIAKEKGYFYYIDKQGDILRAKQDAVS